MAICAGAGTSFRADLQRRRTLIHEFAHVWETVNLSDAERASFMENFGLSGWNDPADRWADRGAGRFAEAFVFALLDQPLQQLKVPVECASMLRAFIQISGSAPLAPGAPECPRSM